MLLAYENLSAADLRGSTLADYLIAIEADFRMLDGETVIYEEPYFPVIELARALSPDPPSDRGAGCAWIAEMPF